MGQVEDGKVTKEDIVEYVDTIEIKKASLGGFDKIDVYTHIQELVSLYGKYTEEQVNSQKQMVEDQKKEIENLKERERVVKEKLDAQNGVVFDQEQEIERQKNQMVESMNYKDAAKDLQNEIAELKQKIHELNKEKEILADQQKEAELLRTQLQELKDYREMAENQKKEIDLLKKEMEEKQDFTYLIEREELRKKVEEQENKILEQQSEIEAKQNEIEEHKKAWEVPDLHSVDEELQEKIREQKQLILQQEQTVQSLMHELDAKEEALKNRKFRDKDSDDHVEEIGEILKEARKEGQRIIDDAKIEAEQEMIKLLKLRAKFKLEEEKYMRWCKQANTEKEGIGEFFKQLSLQYADWNRAMQEMKEKAETFDINRIYKVIGSQKRETENSPDFQSNEKSLGEMVESSIEEKVVEQVHLR